MPTRLKTGLSAGMKLFRQCATIVAKVPLLFMMILYMLVLTVIFKDPSEEDC